HLPGAGLPVAVARRLAPGLLVGRSVHAPDEAAEQEGLGPDYLLLGTIFATASHPDVTPGGTALLETTRARASLPLLAIGGITEHNASAAVLAGADGVAAISSLLAASDPARAAERICDAALDGWRARQEARTLLGAGR